MADVILISFKIVLAGGFIFSVVCLLLSIFDRDWWLFWRSIVLFVGSIALFMALRSQYFISILIDSIEPMLGLPRGMLIGSFVFLIIAVYVISCFTSD